MPRLLIHVFSIVGGKQRHMVAVHGKRVRPQGGSLRNAGWQARWVSMRLLAIQRLSYSEDMY